MSLPRAVVADPRAVATRAPDLTVRSLAHLARIVTEAPWTLSPKALMAARAARLTDGQILHTVLLASLFGHFNRIADATGIELDYASACLPPHAEPETPPYLRPASWDRPNPEAPRALELAMRENATETLAAWRSYALEREAPLDRRQRSLIAQTVAECLGDRSIPASQAEPATAAASSPLDAALVAAAQEVTLAPWQLGAQTVARLRAAGLPDDVAVFDALATASGCGVFSRIEVALAALGC